MCNCYSAKCKIAIGKSATVLVLAKIENYFKKIVQGVLALHDFRVLAKSCKVKIVLSESGLKLSQDSLNADF